MLSNKLYQLRNNANLTQEQFANIVGVSQQSVQKWESGSAVPDLKKLVAISKYFSVSLDSLVLSNDARTLEETCNKSFLKPQYESMHDYEFYPSNPMIEYTQSVEEGLDVEAYENLFCEIAKLPKGEIKKKFGDVLFEIVSSAKLKEGYPYTEPSDLESIRRLRKNRLSKTEYDERALPSKIHGAWMGRICGCLLGKTVEGIRTNELIPFLQETGNYPLHRYIRKSDITDEIVNKYNYPLAHRPYADAIDGMPVDDDTNYVVLAQKIIETYGRDFTPSQVAQTWCNTQSKNEYFTAERVAFCNFIKGFAPPQSAVYKNPYREWIGAQIRGDYFGYINPGNPQLAADMAWRDASISHMKNGIYGEMFISAMLAVAATTNDAEKILLGGLGEIPSTSRLYQSVTEIIDGFRKGVSQQECFSTIHKQYDEYTQHGWCHTISNAMIVAASLLYGKGDFGKSVCMAVETGFDTDCNGATVGSILGMANGIESISEEWTKPIRNTLYTSIFGVGKVKITDCVEKTLQHIRK